MVTHKPTVIYIMGYGRSGSTFLDILLNNHPDIVSAGALSNFFDWIIGDNLCACGKTMSECEFWQPIGLAYRDTARIRDYKKQQLLVEEHKKLLRVSRNELPSELTANYGRVMNALFTSIMGESGSHYVVDSSKSARQTRWRAYALTNYASMDVRLIHLIRDGRAALWSVMKGPGSPERSQPRRKLPRVLRAIFGWVQTNSICSNMDRYVGKPVLTVRYEDLVIDTSRELRRIGTFLKLDMEDVVRKVEAETPLAIGHNLGGNRLRFSGQVQINPDFEWQEKLPRGYKLVFWFLAWPVARRFGYRFIW